MTFFQKALRKKLAGNIDKETFMKNLEVAWKQTLTADTNIEAEVQAALARIKRSGFEDVYKQVGITEEDYRKVITAIVEEKKQARAEKLGKIVEEKMGNG